MKKGGGGGWGRGGEIRKRKQPASLEIWARWAQTAAVITRCLTVTLNTETEAELHLQTLILREPPQRSPLRPVTFLFLASLEITSAYSEGCSGLPPHTTGQLSRLSLKNARSPSLWVGQK